MSTSPRVADSHLAQIATRIGASGETRAGVIAIGGYDGAASIAAFGSAGRDDRFLLTSISKTFTAVQILQLVEQGLLDLDVSIAEYIPEFAVNGKERVTARQILTHTAGIDPTANTAEGPASALSAEDHLAVAMRSALGAQPDVRFEYSSPGFWVLAELVTRLSGLHYTDHLRRHVAEPLGLTTLGYHPGDEPPGDLVPAETEAASAHLPDQVRRVAYPAGGIIGTAADLLAYGRSLLGAGPPLLSPRTVAKFGRPARSGTLFGRPVTWGLGWEIGGPGSLQSERTLFHLGASGVGLWVDLDRKVVVTLLSATWWTLPQRVMAHALNATLAGWDAGHC